jgi:putative ATP-dependent endonuclease of the OLD family
MRLTHFSIENYRSIARATFDDLANVTTLVGPNNEGKSNVLEGLKICLELLRLGRIASGRETIRIRVDNDAYDWESDFPVKKQKADPDGWTTFYLHFQLTDQEMQSFSQTVKSKLNGILPIQLRFNSSLYAEFRVTKPGKGAKALSNKAERICRFIAENLDFAYVPAIRTAETSHDLVNDLVARELRLLEKDERYAKLQEELTKLQQPVLDSIAAKIRTNLTGVLGTSLKEVKIALPSRTRLRAVARAAQITIDDGAPTSLARKGDGVKSLVAIGLLTNALQGSDSTKDIILLIEEPESHLHPKAIHQLKEVLDSLKEDRQILLTTHCPLLVNRSNVLSNIIVSRNKAAPAKDLEQLREILGVRASDNLRHAALIVVVEGADDEISLRALLSHYSPDLKSALGSGSLAFEAIGGASKLSYSLTLLQTMLCNYYVVLDDDKEGRKALEQAKADSLIGPTQISMTLCLGNTEAEFEDLINEDIYRSYFQSKYGVDVTWPFFGGKNKWSARMKAGFTKAGKPWSDKDKQDDKVEIAKLVAAAPDRAIRPASLQIIHSLIEAINRALQGIKS